MATESMLREMTRRRRYVGWVNEEMRKQSDNVTTVATWPDVRCYYEQGYAADIAARKFLHLIHEGNTP